MKKSPSRQQIIVSKFGDAASASFVHMWNILEETLSQLTKDDGLLYEDTLDDIANRKWERDKDPSSSWSSFPVTCSSVE